MHGELDTDVDDAIREIAQLLAAAYERRARIRLLRPPEQAIPSTERLENTGETRPHELTLTAQRKEPTRS